MDMPQPGPDGGPDAARCADHDTGLAGTPACGAAPLAAVAAVLVEAVSGAANGLIYVAADERAAERLAELAGALQPDLDVALFPPWDCLPYDRASPSPASMGGRMATLQALATGPARRLVATSPEALIQRTLPAPALEGLTHQVRLGAAREVEAITAFAWRTGYRTQDEVAEPGDVCLRGEVLDIFPPAASRPCRLEISDGEVRALHAFDPLTQRRIAALEALTLTPASELIAPQGDADPAVFPPEGPRPLGVEHDLPRLSGALDGLLDHAPDAEVVLAPEAMARLVGLAAQVEAAFQAAQAFCGHRDRAAPPQPQALYLENSELEAVLERRKSRPLALHAEATPRFALAAHPLQAAATYVRGRLDAGGAVALAGGAADLDRLCRELARRCGATCTPVASWSEARKAKGGALLRIDADLDAGFVLAEPALCVLTARDVFGARARHAVHDAAAAPLEGEPDLRFGDVVIHQDHGVGVLRALEAVEVDGVVQVSARLEYRDGAALLTPVEALRKVWRYGAEAEAVALDRLNTAGWAKRRAEVEAAIAESARDLVELARARERTEAPGVAPPRRAYERFVARFPYPLTEDQDAAIAAILQDLKSGRPMNRLVCGDVGFGKTEVALRAAAAVALSGWQVAVAAPTTVLARQHLQTFERRFADLGLSVGQLSRLATPAEAKATKAALAAGELQVVVGTHALAGAAFPRLGLLIIDEEQRFGAKLKADLHALAPEAHVLTLTATPIPRTLQAALVGLQEVCLIATPPARRRPVRTLLQPFDAATVQTALRRERARGGQSFVVTPRIEDIAPLARQLAELTPELSVVVAHGELPAQEVDEVMVSFADGEADVLLATNIIESGLDVPRANTMLVHHPDRFGLAQLHQLRGRVGRGRAQASAYLLHDPAHPLSEAARARLETLVAYDRLGAGLAISARDLDLRGAGDLVGEDQAGHLKLIGVGLYQWLLERAVRQARDEPVDDRPEPELALGLTGELPQSYVPDAEVRLNLYARLSRLETAQAIDDFAAELEDRFGPVPPAASTLLALTRAGRICRKLGVAKAIAGPKAVALDFFDSGVAERLAGLREDLESHDGRLVWGIGTDEADRLGRLGELLETLVAAPPTSRSPSP